MSVEVSFCLICYNQEKYILDALKGALSQTYKDMELIISDDCSTDNTFHILQTFLKEYDGEHKITLNRNNVNMGFVPHINKVVLELAQGNNILLAAGDDISFPERTQIMANIFNANSEVYAITSKLEVIDTNGDITKERPADYGPNLIHTLNSSFKTSSFMIGGVNLAFRKRLFDLFGPLSDDCQTEDSTIRNRALLAGSIFEINKVLSQYRIHDKNMSLPKNMKNLSNELKSKQLLLDCEKAYKLNLINKTEKNLIRFKIKISFKIGNYFYELYSMNGEKSRLIKNCQIRILNLIYKSRYFVELVKGRLK